MRWWGSLCPALSHVVCAGGGGVKAFSAFFRIFSRIFPPARSLLTKEEMHCTFVLVYWFHPLVVFGFPVYELQFPLLLDTMGSSLFFAAFSRIFPHFSPHFSAFSPAFLRIFSFSVLPLPPPPPTVPTAPVKTSTDPASNPKPRRNPQKGHCVSCRYAVWHGTGPHLGPPLPLPKPPPPPPTSHLIADV